jgi:beta-phosphoglucomutase
MRKIQAFIFDLDGVITDTSELHYRAWQRIADENGISFSRQENENLRGVSRHESLHLMLKGRVISEETAQTWMERKNSYYIELIHSLSPQDVLPGVHELLKELRTAKILSAIASSSKNASLVIDLLALKPYFQAIVDGRMVTKSKPAPDLFLRAAKEMGCNPLQCVVIEDATAGIEAGQAAGMMTIGLGPEDRVGQANLVLPDLREAHLSKLLASF